MNITKLDTDGELVEIDKLVNSFEDSKEIHTKKPYSIEK